jgi:hypothetical protein
VGLLLRSECTAGSRRCGTQRGRGCRVLDQPPLLCASDRAVLAARALTTAPEKSLLSSSAGGRRAGVMEEDQEKKCRPDPEPEMELAWLIED